MLHEAREPADGFDVLPFHVDPLHCALFESVASRTLATPQGRLDIDLPAVYRAN